MTRVRYRSRTLVVFLAMVTALAAQTVKAETGPPAVAGDPVIAIAGDIACDPGDVDFNAGLGQNGRCQQRATSDVLVSRPFDAVLAPGDIQYIDATKAKFLTSYDPAWGRVKAVTRPAPGNHEYLNPNAAGYFEYFGAAAGDPSRGYYSFDIGAWHVIALNSNCDNVGGCAAGSPQERWLAADLAANAKRCTLAYWHHPRFSSGAGNDPRTDAFWRALYAGGADLVADGHDHIYERFAPQTPDGVADPDRGIRKFTVGTGGKDLQGLNPAQPNSEVRSNSSFGVLQLTLRPTGYDFSFLPVAGSTFGDSGSGQCHYVPDAPAAVTATAGAEAATVTWSPPPDVGVPGLTSYTVTAAPGGATVTTGAGTTTATFSGLTSGTPYTFTAVANNVVGASAPSQPSNAATPSAAPRAPDAPTGVIAKPANASATVSWSAPPSNGSPITKYTVTSSPGSVTAVTSSTAATVFGLTNGTSYTFTVTATNAYGTSPPSAPSNAVTPKPGNRKK
ncbi:MAG: fibronectin type III domain-containing protein [Actinobacteria bacterium]|nr:fibronectin type III domain-containing protein [Actinomycetota bacterium]